MAAMLTAAENRVLPIRKKKQKQDKKKTFKITRPLLALASWPSQDQWM
jgi:hypothetical protein